MTENTLSLNLRQILVLSCLSKADKLSMSELAKAAKCSTAALTGMRDKLMKFGYVLDMPDKNDRRIRYVSITELGKSELAEVRHQIIKLD